MGEHSYTIPDEAFPWKSSEACINQASKITEDDQMTLDNEMEAYVNEKGIPLIYRPYLYEIQKSEKILGEHSAAGYALPFNIVGIVEVKDSPSWIEAAGFNNDENVTIWFHINTFRQKIDNIIFNPDDKRYNDYTKIYKDWDRVGKVYPPPHGAHTHSPEPKAGDVVQLTTFGTDRSWDRGNRMWIITNVEDEIISENFNTAFGHYLWKVTAKRFRYTYENNMSTYDEATKDDEYLGEHGEKGNHQVYDSKTVVEREYDPEEGTLFDITIHKKVYHRDDQDDESRHIFDMSLNVDNFYGEAQEEQDKKDIEKLKGNEDNPSDEVVFKPVDDNGWF